MRLGYVFAYQYHVHIGGDSFYYHYGANLLADGKGFIQPYTYYGPTHLSVQAAEHPPLYIVLLGAQSWLGMSSYTDHQMLSCLIGTATIFVIGYTAKNLFGKGAGLFAAGVVAVYPYFWFNDGGVLSEGTAQLTTAVTVLLAYRFWQKRSYERAVWLGIGIALAILSRAEALLLPVLLLVPLVLFMKGMPWKRRVGLVLASGISTVLVIGPWVGYNLSRFEKPVTVSSGFDITLLSANCPITWYGTFRGYWSVKCALDSPIKVPADITDLSVKAPYYNKGALDFVKAHKRELPMLELAREGRTWGWYRPFQNVEFDSNIETKPLNWGYMGLSMLWILEAASIGGIFMMRRRKIPVTPCVALLVNVAISTGLTFGQSRYRASAEIALVLLGTGGFVAISDLVRRRRGGSPVPAGDVRVVEPVPADPAAVASR